MSQPPKCRAVVVSADELSKCMSASRFLGECVKCERVHRCGLPEAVVGRKQKLQRKKQAPQQKVERLQQRIDSMGAE